jgi:hypothetical protein
MLRVRTGFSGISGSPYLSTMYFMTGDTLADAQAANTAVGAFWNTIDASLINGITWATQAEVTVMTLAGVVTGLHQVTPVTGAGGTTGVLTPPATQGLVRWNTGVFLSGRQLRGRTFIPGIPTSMVSGGVPTGSLVTNVNAAAATLIADANADLGIWSRKGTAIASVLTGQLWNQFAVLRSRRD